MVAPPRLAFVGRGVSHAAHGVWCAINFVVQTVIQPKVVGDSAGLSVTLAMAALIFWGWVLGAFGALLAIPLTLLAKTLLVDVDPAARWSDVLLSSKAAEPDREGIHG
ncbi:AI-2E family transporter [Mycolicibacterium doricum]|uniref:AI-2E family transporter n=1 Tax=Mycolicibacterium doricum TaxID=126673 RepID=UPI000A1695EC|nr:AI-2E family transporter [Mycolicibacterium doricum]